MTGPSDEAAANIIDLYERRAADFDRDRHRGVMEQPWLDRFLAHVPPGGTVLDIGCGMGEPIAAYLIGRGCRVVGVDSSASLIAMCQARFPTHEWIVGDMRLLDLGRRFDGVVAWDSFFHLTMDDQRAMFARFAAHAKPHAPLMFTSGPRAGQAIGAYHGEPLYHSSLEPAEYRTLLSASGFVVEAFVPDDPDCGGHSIWLAVAVSPEPPR